MMVMRQSILILTLLPQAIVERSQAVMEMDAAPVNFSMIAWALGSMNYHPGEMYMKSLLGHLQRSEQIQKFDAQVIFSSLLASGKERVVCS